MAGCNGGAYDLRVLPLSFKLARADRAGTERFVRGGGGVLAEALPAWNDETGY